MARKRENEQEQERKKGPIHLLCFDTGEVARETSSESSQVKPRPETI